MPIVVSLAVIVNIFSIIMLLVGLFCKFEHPKDKAIFGYSFVGGLIFYIIMLSIVSIYGLILKRGLYSCILFLCVISPFILGKLVKYETLKKYTVIQIMFFIVSLFTLILK